MSRFQVTISPYHLAYHTNYLHMIYVSIHRLAGVIIVHGSVHSVLANGHGLHTHNS